MFRLGSMERNAVLLGFSLPRLILAALILLLALAFWISLIISLRSSHWQRTFLEWLGQWLSNGERFAKALTFLGLALAFSLVLLPAIWFKGESLGMLTAVYQRAAGVFLWIPLLILETMALLRACFRSLWNPHHYWEPPARISLLRFFFHILLLAALLALVCSIYFDLEQFYSPLLLSLLLTGLLSVSLWLKVVHGKWALRVFLLALMVYVVVFLAYRGTTFFMERQNTPGKAYFNELADAWLHGRLYLEEPSQTHDLTLHEGHWYVANPPLVAALMVPVVRLYGLQALNTVVFSIFFGALNAALVFCLLEIIAHRGWTHLNTAGNLWLTGLFAFGTVHWYLAIVGKMWFMSQTVTVTFLAIAALLAATGRPAWMAGFALGLGLIARPNILMAWPLLLGFAVQHLRESGRKITWGWILRWSVLSAIPLALAVVTLLGYNLVRFNNPFDFGYLTENVADFMAGDLKDYGTFHPHFLARNLRVMFFNLPEYEPACGLFIPKAEGMSMFLVTPALFWLAASFRRQPFVWGSWAAVLLGIALIANYYNTGAWQFGYKYMLDFAVPLIVLLAVGAGSRVRWPLVILILLSVASNFIGVLWWFGRWCVY